MLLQATPPLPLRSPTILDYVASGGCIGFLVIGFTVIGLILSLVFLLVFKRRGAILGPVLLSTVPITFGLIGTGYAFMLINQMAGFRTAEGEAPLPAEVADSQALAMVTTWMGLAGSFLILLFALLAMLVKPNPPPPPPK